MAHQNRSLAIVPRKGTSHAGVVGRDPFVMNNPNASFASMTLAQFVVAIAGLSCAQLAPLTTSGALNNAKRARAQDLYARKCAKVAGARGQTNGSVAGPGNPTIMAGHIYGSQGLSVPGSNIDRVCPPGYYYDAATKSCMPIGHLPTGHAQVAGPVHYPASNAPFTIFCPPGYYYDAATKSCVPIGHLPTGHAQVAGPVHYPASNAPFTIFCPPGYYYDAATKSCVPIGHLPTGHAGPSTPMLPYQTGNIAHSPRVSGMDIQEFNALIEDMMDSTLGAVVSTGRGPVVVDEAAFAATSSPAAKAAAAQVIKQAAANPTQDPRAVSDVLDSIAAAQAVRSNPRAYPQAAQVAMLSDMKASATNVAMGMQAGDTAALATAQKIADVASTKGPKQGFANAMAGMVSHCCNKCAAKAHGHPFTPLPGTPGGGNPGQPFTPFQPKPYHPSIPGGGNPGIPMLPQGGNPGQPMQPYQPPGQPMQPYTPTPMFPYIPQTPATGKPFTPFNPPQNPTSRMPANPLKPGTPMTPFTPNKFMPPMATVPGLRAPAAPRPNLRQALPKFTPPTPYVPQTIY